MELAVVEGAEEDILRLQVAVHDAAHVRRLQPRGDLLDDEERLLQAQRRRAVQASAQALAVEELEDEVGLPVVEHVVVHHLDDVRVAKLRDDGGLLAEAGHQPGVDAELALQHLDRHAPGQAEVARLPDRAHAPDADHPGQLVGVAKNGSCSELGHRAFATLAEMQRRVQARSTRGSGAGRPRLSS